MHQSYDRGMVSRRLVNLVGALGIALADGQQRAMREASGLADSEVAALNVVGSGEGLSISEVRAALGLTHPGAVRVVDRLVVHGLVVRGPGADGRTVGLRLTPAGGEAYDRQAAARVAWLARFATVLEGELAQAEATVERLLALAGGTHDDGEHLCRLCDEEACPQDRCPVTLAVGREP